MGIMNNVEIERKFLIEYFPETLPLVKEFQVEQGYLSINPEVRIRKKWNKYATLCFITIKSDGDLVRKEVECPIPESKYEALKEMLGKPIITKDYRVYQLMDHVELECSLVDKGLDTEFMYAEIEFPSIQQAKSFIMPPWFIKDITNDSSYKMKNYWKSTRGD